MLTPLVPYPPHDGDKLRLYYFLKYLKSRGHKIDLFCLSRVKEDLEQAEQLRPLCRSLYVEHITNWDLVFNLIGGVLVGSSLNVASYFSPELREVLKTYATSSNGQNIDVVFCHRLRMAPHAFRFYLKYVGIGRSLKMQVAESFLNKPVVLDLTDSLISYTGQLRKQSGAPFLRRLAAWWDFWFLRRDEVMWSQRASQAITIAQPDADVLTSHGLAKDKITVVPNGVDLSARVKKGKPSGYPAKGKVACFVGNMGYAPNEEGALWFIRSVWPRVKKAVPDAVFMAVGGTPRKVLWEYHNGTDVLVTGWVPQVEPYLIGASVSIAPLRFAGGMQNKVAVSMGLGVPVVATSAATGWLPDAGKSLVWVADDADAFAAKIVEVLKNPKKARTQAVKGKKFVVKNYPWKTAGQKLEKILKQAIG